MTPTSSRTAARAFTRRSVESYLEAAAAERARLELAIAEARARASAAQSVLERLDVLCADGRTPGPGQGREREPEPEEAPDRVGGAAATPTLGGDTTGGLVGTRAR